MALRITYYGYNAFLLETEALRIAVDPGAKFLYRLRMPSLIPPELWPGVTHILITHGDPDHYWHADRLAAVSGAPVIGNTALSRENKGKTLLLGPRSRGLTFNWAAPAFIGLKPGEHRAAAGLDIAGVPTVHGTVEFPLGPFTLLRQTPGPRERVGWGAIGFSLALAGKTILILGDTLLLEKEWKALPRPDVLILPIGGGRIHNTMDGQGALRAVEILQPRRVIPCHYNCPFLFSRSFNRADPAAFQAGAADRGALPLILSPGETQPLG